MRLDARHVDLDLQESGAPQPRVPCDGQGRWSSPYGVTLRGGVAHMAMLRASLCPVSMHPVQLTPSPRGSLTGLVATAIHETGMHARGTHQSVVLDVHAVGINFRDVLNVLGMYPGDPGPPGADCAGVVVHAPHVDAADVSRVEVERTRSPQHSLRPEDLDRPGTFPTR